MTKLEATEQVVKLFDPPFRLDTASMNVLDANDQVVTVVYNRGLIQKFNNALSLQDALGELIASALTEKWERIFQAEDNGNGK